MPTDDKALSDENICALMRETAATLIQNNRHFLAEMQRRLGGGPWTAASEVIVRGWSEILFDWALRSEQVARIVSSISNDARVFVYQTMRPIFVEAFVECARERWLAQKNMVN